MSNIRSIFCRDDGAERPNLLCHVSNFRPVKRVPDVVQVFARVCKEIPARLILVGDGPERSAVEQLCRSLDVEQDVSFLGKQDSIAEIISSCDVFLLPSETESFGLAALEAMACCVPVVATRAGGIPEVVTDSETGYLSDVGDIETMTANVLRILGDSQLKAALGDAAHRRVVGSFAIREVVDRYEQYYFEVLER